jgi:hypothetical protein
MKILSECKSQSNSNLGVSGFLAIIDLENLPSEYGNPIQQNSSYVLNHSFIDCLHTLGHSGVRDANLEHET